MTALRFLLGCCAQIIMAVIIATVAAFVAYGLTEALHNRPAEVGCYVL